MGQFLNNKEPYDKYRTVKNGPILLISRRYLKN